MARQWAPAAARLKALDRVFRSNWGALRHCDLHRERPDTARGGMYQHDVSLTDLQAMLERLIGGHAGKGDRLHRSLVAIGSI